MSLLKGNWILKILSLILAVGTYLYISTEIENAEKKERGVVDPSYKLIKLTAKTLPVKVRLTGAPAEGYKVLAEKVSSNPPTITAIGPEALLEDAQSAETALVDLSDESKTVVKNIPLESVAGIHLAGESYTVQVTAPIEKSEN